MEQREAGATPRVVRAGPVTALLDGGFLRRIRVGPHEVLRGVYAAVRDQNWGTIEPRYSRFELEQGESSFRVSFTAEHVEGEIDFVWDGEIVGEPTGRLTFALDGACRRAFKKNRLGYCVLHPPGVAGRPYVRETPAGPIEERFPDLISPSRDVTDMEAIRYAVGPVGVELRFEGDRFDMEDQRNWTDASYKTFCTPLRQPYPVQLEAGHRVRQRVVLDLSIPPDATSSVPSGTAAVGRGGAVVAAQTAADVVVRPITVGRLPPIGLGAPFHGRPLAPAALERLRPLRLAHLRVELDLRGVAWRDVLSAAGADAAALGAGLDVAALTDAAGAGLEDLASALRSMGAPLPGAAPRAESGPAPGGAAVPLLRVAPFAERVWVTTRPLIARARAAGLPGQLGGGSRTDFAQLNMQRDLLPVGELDFAAFAINPQVHAFDDMSIVETLGVHADVVASARALAGPGSPGGVPIVVGPITLRPRFNPNATAPEPPGGPDVLPRHADPRQREPFAAAWTLGSLRALAAAGAAALTYFETTGPAGVADEAGVPYPVHALLAAVAPFVGADLLDLSIADPLAVAALALRDGQRSLILVANLTPKSRRIAVVLPSGTARSVELGPYAFAAADSG